jgi:hypothetical protein
MPPYSESSRLLVAVDADADGNFAVVLETTRTSRGTSTTRTENLAAYESFDRATVAATLLSMVYKRRVT